MWSSKNVKKSHRPSQVSSSTRADPNDSVSLPNGRDRRRDPDDTGTSLQLFTENPPAQNFRTTPTQTRTFKRQPTRTTERDREKGSGEDRGAKYWQEQHRSLPHEFDRDRLEAREQVRGRNGEASDDRRRGADPVRQGRDNRNEYPRDQGTRKRPHSNVQDSLSVSPYTPGDSHRQHLSPAPSISTGAWMGHPGEMAPAPAPHPTNPSGLMMSNMDAIYAGPTDSCVCGWGGGACILHSTSFFEQADYIHIEGRDDKNEYRRDQDTRKRPRSKVRDSPSILPHIPEDSHRRHLSPTSTEVWTGYPSETTSASTHSPINPTMSNVAATYAGPMDSCICGCGGSACIPQREYDRQQTDPLSALELQEMIRFGVNGKCGYPLRDALNKWYTGLDERDEKMFVNSKSSISIRLEWLPYEEWTKQIRTLTWRKTPDHITRAKLATEVAKRMELFFEEMQAKPGDPSYREYHVRPGFVDLDHLVLVALKRVAKSSWMPHFRLITPSSNTPPSPYDLSPPHMMPNLDAMTFISGPSTAGLDTWFAEPAAF